MGKQCIGWAIGTSLALTLALTVPNLYGKDEVVSFIGWFLTGFTFSGLGMVIGAEFDERDRLRRREQRYSRYDF